MLLPLLIAAVFLAFDPKTFEQPALKAGVLLFALPLALLLSWRGGTLRKVASAPLPGALVMLALLFGWSVVLARAVALDSAAAWKDVLALFCLLLAAAWARVVAIERPRTIPLTLVALGALCAAIAVLQAAGIDALGTGEREATSVFGNTNRMAEVLAPILPLALCGLAAFRGLGRAVALVAVPLLAAAVVLSGSRGAAIAAIVAVLAQPLLARVAGGVSGPRRLALALLALGVLLPLPIRGLAAYRMKNIEESTASIASPSYATNQQRWLLLRAAVAMAETRPVAGFGPGSFRIEFPPFRDPVEARMPTLAGAASAAEDPHDQYVLLWIEQGAVGLALFLLAALLALGALRAADLYPEGHAARAVAPGIGGAILCWLVVAIFRSPLEHAPAALELAVLVGAAAAYAGGAASKQPRASLAFPLLPALLLVAVVFGARALLAELSIGRHARLREQGLAEGSVALLRDADGALAFGQSMDPSNLDLLQLRAAHLERLGHDSLADRQRARTVRAMLLQRDPWHVPSLVRLAAADLEADRFGAALERLDRAARARGIETSSSIDPWDVRLALLLELREDVAAARLLLGAVKRGVLESGVLEVRARAAEAEGRLTFALPLYEALLDVVPASGELAERVADLCERLAKPEDARRMHLRAQLAWGVEALRRRDWAGARRSADVARRIDATIESRAIVALADAATGDRAALDALLADMEHVKLPSFFTAALDTIATMPELSADVKAILARSAAARQ